MARIRRQSLTKTSRFLSYVLRHNPNAANIVLDGHGWANVSDLLAGLPEKHRIDRETLDHIVATDEKGRYSFSADGLYIRANQGHSIEVDVELEDAEPPDVLYHGTGAKYVESIDEQGLISKSRLYVHLSSDVDTAINVGSRHGEPVVYEVLAKEMAEEGHRFLISKNGVWLTDKVPARFLRKLEEGR